VGTGSDSGASEFTYCADIKPIFDASCARCHAGGDQFPDLDVFAERNPGLGSVSTQLDRSLNRMTIGDMPPQGEPDPAVTDRQLAIIEAWKAQGMPEGSCN
jgi:mono/diheme cytochrome c family protein